MSNINAIVLAGGLGTRLRPLTLGRPKPLCTVMGESVLERLLRLMPEWHIKEAALSTMYLSEQIQNKFGNEYNGIKLHYVKETKPLGSAGGAKLGAMALGIAQNENFLVLSGDGIFDFDLNNAIDFHEKNNADVTIISYPSKEPLEYGVILSDKNGRINSFSEKPAWSKVRSDTVNTGIYIIRGSVFQDIPDGRQFDFSKDLFPHLLGSGRIMYSYEMHGYWCDIGDISAYYKCNMDAISGKIQNINPDDALTEKELKERGVKYSLPCYISRNANISDKATIDRYSVISGGAKVSDGAIISGSIILENVNIGVNATVQNSIICENITVGNKAIISPGCTIGAGCRISEGATVSEGLSIWPGKIIEKGFCVTQDVLFENKSKGFYTDDGFYAGNVNASINSDYIARLGRAFAGAAYKIYSGNNEKHIARIGIMHDGEPESALIAETLLCGINSTGAQSFSFMRGFEAQAKYIASTFMTDIVLFVTRQDDERIINAYDRLALQPTREFERAVEACYKNTPSQNNTKLYNTEYIDGAGHNYYSELIRCTEEEFGDNNYNNTCGLLCDIKCCFSGEISPHSANYTVKKALTELGADVANEYNKDTILIHLSDNGLSAELETSDESGRIFFDSYHITAALISYGLKRGNSIYSLPSFAPLIYTELIKKSTDNQNNISLLYKNSTSVKRHFISESRKIYDMCFAVIRLLCILKKENKSLRELLCELPTFEIRIRNITNDDTGGENRASIMKHLCEKYGQPESISEQDGISVSFSGGNVTVVPRRTGGFRLISEAVSAEFAEEISEKFFDEIKEISKKCAEE